VLFFLLERILKSKFVFAVHRLIIRVRVGLWCGVLFFPTWILRANREVLGVVCVATVVVGLRTRLVLWGSLHIAALC
jgi:hypothetical protein